MKIWIYIAVLLLASFCNADEGESTTEESTDSTTEESTDSTTEDSTDSTTEESTDSTTEESTGSTTEGSTQPENLDSKGSTTEESTDSTTEDSTGSTTEGSTGSTTEGSTGSTTEGSSDATTEKSTGSTTEGSTPAENMDSKDSTATTGESTDSTTEESSDSTTEEEADSDTDEGEDDEGNKPQQACEVRKKCECPCTLEVSGDVTSFSCASCMCEDTEGDTASEDEEVEEDEDVEEDEETQLLETQHNAPPRYMYKPYVHIPENCCKCDKSGVPVTRAKLIHNKYGRQSTHARYRVVCCDCQPRNRYGPVYPEISSGHHKEAHRRIQIPKYVQVPENCCQCNNPQARVQHAELIEENPDYLRYKVVCCDCRRMKNIHKIIKGGYGDIASSDTYSTTTFGYIVPQISSRHYVHHKKQQQSIKIPDYIHIPENCCKCGNPREPVSKAELLTIHKEYLRYKVVCCDCQRREKIPPSYHEVPQISSGHYVTHKKQIHKKTHLRTGAKEMQSRVHMPTIKIPENCCRCNKPWERVSHAELIPDSGDGNRQNLRYKVVCCDCQSTQKKTHSMTSFQEIHHRVHMPNIQIPDNCCNCDRPKEPVTYAQLMPDKGKKHLSTLRYKIVCCDCQS